MNAKEEFLKEVGKVESTIKCAEIEFGSKRLELKVGYTDDDYAKFIESLDFKYDNGYGTHGLSGTIWYEDGTWSERGEYDGSEWWEHKQMPKIPESLDSDTKSKMTNLKVVSFDSESLEFDNGIVLSSYHNQDCCESHYLSLSDLTMADFEGLEFDLSNDNFFERIEDYGIALKPIVGFPVRIPAYGYNNGYYSSDLTLTISNGKNLDKSFDITECQSISG